MDGTPLSTSAMKRSTPFTRAVPYSARKIPPSTPTGIPMIDASASNSSVPTIAFAIPPPASPTGLGKCVTRFEQPRSNLRRVTDHHRHRHRFAQRTAEPEYHRTEQTFPRVTEHCDACHFPTGRAQSVRGFALQIRNAPQDFARDRGNDGQNHNRNNDSTSQHARAVNRAAEKWSPTQYPLQKRKRIIAQPRNHDENSPQPENYAGDRGQHFDKRHNRLPHPERREFRQINRRRDAQRHRDK